MFLFYPFVNQVFLPSSSLVFLFDLLLQPLLRIVPNLVLKLGDQLIIKLLIFSIVQICL